MRIPPRYLRMLGFQGLFDTDEHASWDVGVVLGRDAVRARRRLALGASRAAQAALAERAVGARNDILCWAGVASAAAAFRAVANEDARLEMLLAAFVPTVYIHPGEHAAGEMELVWWRDGTPPHDQGKGVVLAHFGSRHYLAGEVLLVPPALRGEGRRRSDWIRAVDLDLPPANEHLGPFWSLGDGETWRLDVIGWRERLVLAGLLGTRMGVCAVVCESSSLPRIGFVVEKAGALGRTLVHVPLDAVPESLRADLQATSEVRWGDRIGRVGAEVEE